MKNLLIILSIIGGFLYANYQMGKNAVAYENRIIKHEVKVQQVRKEEQEKIPTTEDILSKLVEVFGVEGKEVLVKSINVFYLESKFNPFAVNWNCRYDGKSTSCRPEDRHLAWSVDCGLIQKNVIGQTCPSKWFEWEYSIEQAHKIYKQSGFKPWVASRYL